MQIPKLLKNRDSYTASTEDIKVGEKNLKEIVFGLQFLQAGATAATVATLITHTSSITLKHGGEIITDIRFDDLYVLNLLLGNKPFYLLSAGDNQFGELGNVKIPVEVTTDLEMYIKCTRAGLATIDTELLTLLAVSGDKTFPAKRPLSLKYVSDNITTSFKDKDISVSGKMLYGLLVFNTTIPVAATSADFTVGELKLKVNTRVRGEWAADAMDNIRLSGEETVNLGIADNYRFLNLFDDPYPADDLKASVKSYSAATDAYRLIGIYR